MRTLKAGVRTASLAMLIAFGLRPQVASTVTPERIRQVSVGMSKADVHSILGAPLRERPGDNAGGVLMDYAIRGVAWRSFSLWIYLNARGSVDTVRVTESPLVFPEDYALYDAQPKSPVYEHPQFTRLITAQR
jgi:SmpA / OmlA family